MATVGSGLKFALHIIFHPFDGFYDMRHEKRGNIYSSLIIYFFYIQSVLVSTQYNGFLFTTFNPREYNILKHLITIVVPLVLWCVSNWCFTALTNGEGRFVDIVMATGYALFPLSVVNIIYVLLSNAIVLAELDFLKMISIIGTLWSGLLIFCGTLTIHQFTVKKTIFTIIVTICGMVFIVFLTLLFGSIVDDMLSFFTGLVTEIRLRT